MKNLKQILSNLLKDESGQDLIEYALVAAIVSLAAVTTLGTLASSISAAFTSINTKLNTAL
jgi:pilus assembly protein Flp/PilA